MKKVFNWKTTLSGVTFVGGLCGSLAGMSGQIPALEPYVQYLLLASFISGAVNSYWQKDKDVTGGKKEQQSLN
jgi:hypothetical protein